MSPFGVWDAPPDLSNSRALTSQLIATEPIALQSKKKLDRISYITRTSQRTFASNLNDQLSSILKCFYVINIVS